MPNYRNGRKSNDGKKHSDKKSEQKKAADKKNANKNEQKKVVEKIADHIVEEKAVINEKVQHEKIEVKPIDVLQTVDDVKSKDDPIKEPIKEEEEEKKAITTDIIEPYIKHPLKSKWTLWYYIPEKDREWNECQHRIGSFAYVEDFWSLFLHLKKPTDLKNGCDYSLFKNDIRPMWEDRQNVEGGRWVMNISKQPRHQSPLNIDDVWQEVLLFLIGEYFEYTDDICGTVLNIRLYGNKVSIWTANQEKERLFSIGNSVKSSLILPFPPQINFESHDATKQNAKVFGKASSKTLFTL